MRHLGFIPHSSTKFIKETVEINQQTDRILIFVYLWVLMYSLFVFSFMVGISQPYQVYKL